jgi:hypothetical protein
MCVALRRTMYASSAPRMIPPRAPRSSAVFSSSARGCTSLFQSDVPRTDSAQALGNSSTHAVETRLRRLLLVRVRTSASRWVLVRSWAREPWDAVFHRFLSLLLLPLLESTLRPDPKMLASIDALSNRRGAIRLDEDEPFEDEKLSLPNSLPESAATEARVECSRT